MKYRPVNVLPADWSRVKDFCRQAVLTYGPVNAHVAGQLLSTVTHFVLWATHEEHAPLDYEGVFHPSLMGRYLRSRVSNKSSGAYKTLHSRLFRVASAVAGIDHNRKKRSQFAVPVREYTPQELADLESWAGAHRTEVRRQQARTVLALMGGAGLWTGEALAVRDADILTDAGGYSIRVSGRNARIVPVLSDFAQYLDGVDVRSDEARFVLFPDGSSTATRAGSLRLLYQGAHPAPNPQWLRDTWMLRQLRVLPASIVMQAAGMPDAATLRRYLPNASLPYEGWESALRNPAAYGRSMNNSCDRISVYGDAAWRAAHARLRGNVETANTKLGDEPRNSAANVSADPGGTGACGRSASEAAHAPLSTDAAPVNDELGEAPNPVRRPRRRDPARDGDHRRPTPPKPDGQTHTTDSTAIAAGAKAVPFTRTPPPEQHDGGERQPADGVEATTRRIEALEADWTPKRPRKKSRYEALPPDAVSLQAMREDLAAAVTDTRSDETPSEFAALRKALLAEARQSARGGKR